MAGEPVVTVDWTAPVVIRDDTRLPIDRHEYWTIVPSRSRWEAGDGYVSPLDFGFMLHNARIGQGLLPPLAKMTDHFESRSLKDGNALHAEELIEARRTANFPEKPSRLRSYFLNAHRPTAEQRAKVWGWHERRIVRCHLLPTTGSLHGARVSNFEAVVANPSSEAFADRYWTDEVRVVADDNKHDVEILADCGLYFPDWESFELIEEASLADAEAAFGSSWKRLGK